MSNVFQPGFGQQLKAGREATGLSTVDVASKLKLTARQIEALEAEDFQHLPGEVFVRGFVRNYARLVGINPDDLLSPMDAIATVSETITAPSEGLTFRKPGMQRWVVLPVLVASLFMGLVALLYHWLREGEDALVVQPVVVQPVPAPVVPAPLEPAVPPAEGAAPVGPGGEPGTANPVPGAATGATSTTTSITLPATSPSAGVAAPAVAPTAAPVAPVVAPASAKPAAASAPAALVPAPAATPLKPAASIPAPTTPAAKPVPPPAAPVSAPAKPAAATPTTAAAGKPVAAAPVAAPPPAAAKPPAKPAETAAPAAKPVAAQGLRFAAATDAWIQVVDGKGKRFSKLVKAGAVETFSGEPPFKLVVGEAAQVKMSYNGHSVDLLPFIGEKVARLTLE
ncbi:MAG: DUF4115 domain-containing protein [Betaproteobacteria bacterium]|nr:DUF4115 domain-containing protein [Betaproteobacteria bacterium]